MREASEETLTEAVIEKLASCSDPRLQSIMTALIRHLHAFAREVELSEAEWAEGIRFLTATGQMCDERRQEFILLSDVLGLSMLVDAINHRKPEGATESTVLGPFYVAGAPELEPGATIMRGGGGEPVAVRGRVLTPGSQPIAGALVDVWQTAPNGFYDTQDPTQPAFNLRGRFRTDGAGAFHFRTVKPASYPLPTDGTVGRMLAALGRHPFRPAHIHFIVQAPGYESLTTHLFAAGDPYLDSDAVFGVKNSLIVEFRPAADGNGLTLDYDFGLKPAA